MQKNSSAMGLCLHYIFCCLASPRSFILRYITNVHPTSPKPPKSQYRIVYMYIYVGLVVGTLPAFQKSIYYDYFVVANI